MNNNEREVTIFLANGKTLNFTNVLKKEYLKDENGYPYCKIRYFDKRINKQRITYFQLINDSVIGYAEDK